MCRFITYLGKEPVLLKHILDAPENSLISQSKAAREGPSPLNADGFGIGWYQQDIDPAPAVFKSILPAWNDANLLNIAGKVKSTCFAGHVRASTIGAANTINCHPFSYKDYMFVHNGTIFGIEKIGRALMQSLDDRFYKHIEGHTDSEIFFALLMDRLHQLEPPYDAKQMAIAMRQSIDEINHLQKAHPENYVRLNTMLTNGKEMIVTRYYSGERKNILPIYYTVGDHWDAIQADTVMAPVINNQAKAVLITTEPLTQTLHTWEEIPVNHMLIVDDNLQCRLEPLGVTASN
jgi:predicted glutamine amidotransferase